MDCVDWALWLHVAAIYPALKGEHSPSLQPAQAAGVVGGGVFVIRYRFQYNSID